ncbi:MAG: tetratricopeptide repeat protein [Bacteroidota bacterium]|nr:tetratricopeptide repeat protein [Bacteroidota bacterium]
MKQLLCFLLFVACVASLSGQDIKVKLNELDTAYYHNDLVQAKKLIAEILPKSDEKIRDPAEFVSFLNTCGSVYYGSGDFKEAAGYFQRGADIAKELLGENDHHYALALFNLAMCYQKEGRYTDAEPLFLKSLPVLAVAFGQSSIEYTRCFYMLAMLYIDMGRYADAEGMCAAAVNFYKEMLGQTSSDYLGSLGSMGVIYQGLGRYEKAEEIFVALINYYKSLPSYDQGTMVTLQNNLGELYRHMGNYPDAESVLTDVLAISRENSLSSAMVLNNLALVKKALGKYSEAENNYKKAISIYKALNKTNHPDYTNPVNNMGELYRVMGRFQEAVYAFEEVIELRRKLLGTLHPNYANALNNLALVEFWLQKYDDAEGHLLECKEIYKKTLGEKDKLYANCLNNLASLYQAKGSYVKAEQYYKECLEIYKGKYGETSDKYALYLGGLAGTYRQMKRYGEAIELNKQSLEILKNKLGENHYDYIETNYYLAEIYKETGNFTEAEKHYLQSVKGYLFLIEQYFPSLSEKEKTEFYFTVCFAFENFNSFVVQMVQQFPKENHDVLISRMYDNQLVIKSLLLRETGKVKVQIAASGNEELKKEYEELVKLRENIVQQYRLSATDLAEVGIDLPGMEKQANELEQKITSQSSLSPGPKKDPVSSWKDVQQKLKQGECMVEIVRVDYYRNGRPTDSVFYTAMIIDKASVSPKFVLIPDGKTLEEKYVSEYRNFVKSKKEDVISYDRFWAPLKNAIGNSGRIYFSPDGAYQQVNLYTLMNPSTKKYLIDEISLTLLTNSKDLLETKITSGKKSAEIFSFPDYDLVAEIQSPASDVLSRYGYTSLPELPGTKIESDTISGILRSHNWKVNLHLRGDASEEQIKKVSGPQILHIATHGFFLQNLNESHSDVNGIQMEKVLQNPLLRSGLMLAGAASIARDSVIDNTKEDGILTAYEAANLDLGKTDLVVLSACETGLGEVLNGQGVYGLQRAFMVAGASSVIMSLWVVDDYATQELMSTFYREWLKDPTPGAKQSAFRKAQLKLKEKYPSPYFWGAFVMIGN